MAKQAGGTRARITKRQLALSLMVAGVCTALAGAVLATPATGILSGTVLARGRFLDPVDIKFKIDHGRQEVIHVADARETVVQQIVIGPGGQTGWHSHPGPVVVLIKSGTLTLYSGEHGCEARAYSAGQAFVDSGQGHVHLAANRSTTENVELWATYFDVPPQGAFRLDAANPGNCPF
jgi:quercetin dioxygenase-like cupin family protein